MNSLAIYVIIFVCIEQTFASIPLGDRKQRQFSLFSVVTFKNSACTAKSAGIGGICMTSTECTDASGTSDGNCAAAFGVCCLVKVSTCGSSLSRNCTYIENSGYPSTHSSAETGCIYTVSKCATDICQIRLDFTAVTLKQPASSTTGQCTTDTLIALGTETSTNAIYKPPTLCGTLTGQHMYLDAGRAAGTAATVTLTIGASGTSSWRIKVTQIECWNSSRAPPGCLQYFTGRQNTFTSFNWSGDDACSTGCHLGLGQKYSICFRPEEGMCGVAYNQSTVGTSLKSFDTSTLTDGGVGVGQCVTGYLQIQTNIIADGNIFCGRYLADVDAATTAGTIYGTEFDLEVFAVQTLATHAGFSVIATQYACKT